MTTAFLTLRATAVFACFAALPALAQYHYNVLAPTKDLPNNRTVSTWTYAINNSDQIAGYETDPVGNHSVVVWNQGVPGVLPLPTSYVYEFGSIEINNPGQVLANVQFDAPGPIAREILWTNGVPFVLPPGPTSCSAGQNPVDLSLDLNNNGHVLGVTTNSLCATYWIWNGQTFTIVVPPTPPSCVIVPFSAVALNDQDDVLGLQSPPACSSSPLPTVVKLDGSFEFYQTPAGATITGVTSINNQGQVDGSGRVQNGPAVALFWASPGATPVEIPSPRRGQVNPLPGKLNSNGEFILTTQNQGGTFPYIWNNGTITPLPPHGIVSADSGGGINDSGNIAVTGFIGGNVNAVRGLWIIPIP